MSPILNSQGAVVATAMVVSGTVIVLALRIQKLLQTTEAESPAKQQLLRSCLSLDGRKKKKMMKKKVKFASDVRDPIGNSEEFRRRKCNNGRKEIVSRREVGGMPANRLALYSGIIRDRPVHPRLTSCH